MVPFPQARSCSARCATASTATRRTCAPTSASGTRASACPVPTAREPSPGTTPCGDTLPANTNSRRRSCRTSCTVKVGTLGGPPTEGSSKTASRTSAKNSRAKQSTHTHSKEKLK
uniref:(northern house mosquito) hypothetical protein n=1 Tax=Culex pipiens TaxID=7175 RepID=A0A8D8ADZ8_CULPI